MNTQEMIKEIRSYAKEAGLTFKKQNAKINGQQVYQFNIKDSNKVVMSNCTLNSAYENCLSGYISSFNKKNRNV